MNEITQRDDRPECDFRIRDLFPRDVVYPEPDLSGFVYVVGMLAPTGPIYKIGKSSDVKARVRQFNPTLPYPTCVVFALWSKNALGQEEYVHRHFAQYRLRGEWFALPEEALVELHELAEIMRRDTPELLLDSLCAMPLELWRIHQEWDLAERQGDVAQIKELRPRLMRAMHLSEEEIKSRCAQIERQQAGFS